MSAILRILKKHKKTYEQMSLGQRMLIDALMPYSDESTLDVFLQPFLKSKELKRADFNKMGKQDKVDYLKEKGAL